MIHIRLNLASRACKHNFASREGYHDAAAHLVATLKARLGTRKTRKYIVEAQAHGRVRDTTRKTTLNIFVIVLPKKNFARNVLFRA